jgi:CubicO group peptidase (beta-lactamase class C family)
VLGSSGQLATLYDDYATLLSERVLSPIGMESATIYYSQAQANPNHANSYICQNNQPTLAESEDFDGDPLAPSGSLKANVVEMALYISTQLGRGVAPNGTQVVSEENLSATWQPYLEDYGMGWEVSEYNAIEIIMHTGSYDNFESVIGFMPALDTGFVVLTNAETGEALTSQAPFVLLDLLSAREGMIWLPIVVAQ